MQGDCHKYIIEHKWGTNKEFTSCNVHIYGGYNESLERIKEMADELRRDFPDYKIEDKDIKIGRPVSGSGFMDGFKMIHWYAPVGTRHPDYTFQESIYWKF